MKKENQQKEIVDLMKAIKDGLLNNQKGVYSIIGKNFEAEIEQYGVIVFAPFLAEKLEISKDQINIRSLRSAMRRIKDGTIPSPSVTKKDVENRKDIDMDRLDWNL